MSKLRICKQGVTATRIDVAWKTELGTEKWVSVVVEVGINVSATGTLNDNGIAALEQALAIAKIVYLNGGIEITISKRNIVRQKSWAEEDDNKRTSRL